MPSSRASPTILSHEFIIVAEMVPSLDSIMKNFGVIAVPKSGLLLQRNGNRPEPQAGQLQAATDLGSLRGNLPRDRRSLDLNATRKCRRGHRRCDFQDAILVLGTEFIHIDSSGHRARARH